MPELPDTIKYPDAFIKSESEDFDGVCDFKSASKAVNRRGITPMDFDKVIEINYHYLVEETKDLGVPVPPGQRQCLERLRDAKSFTVFFTEGKSKPIKTTVIYADGTRKTYHGDKRDEIIKRWANAADENRISNNKQQNLIKCEICGIQVAKIEKNNKKICTLCCCADEGWNT